MNVAYINDEYGRIYLLPNMKENHSNLVLTAGTILCLATVDVRQTLAHQAHRQ
ncbi:MAG: hypothetical protein ACI9IT_000135 [Glaciecola sp.]|jgi:hypothetical protein